MPDEWKNVFNCKKIYLEELKEAIEDLYQHLFVSRAHVHPIGKIRANLKLTFVNVNFYLNLSRT